MQPNYNHNQGPNNLFLFEANDHKRGAYSIACWIKKYNICLSFFCEHCSSSGLRRTFKVFVLYENVKLLDSSFILFLFCNGHSFWNSQCQCHNWLNVTAYHYAPWHYKMLRFLFDSVSLVYMYMHTKLYSRALSARGGLNPHFILDIVAL